MPRHTDRTLRADGTFIYVGKPHSWPEAQEYYNQERLRRPKARAVRVVLVTDRYGCPIGVREWVDGPRDAGDMISRDVFDTEYETCE